MWARHADLREFPFCQAPFFKLFLSFAWAQGSLASQITSRVIIDAHKGQVMDQSANHSLQTEPGTEPSKLHEGNDLFCPLTVVSLNSARHIVGAQLILVEQMNEAEAQLPVIYFPF